MSIGKSLWKQTKVIYLFSIAIVLLALLLNWMQWKYKIIDHSLDIYTGLIAVAFTLLGIWVTLWLTRPKHNTIVVEKKVYISPPDDFILNETELKKLHLSNREYEVLQCLSKGLSNAEISTQLVLSLSTVKTHVSNLLLKMDVKNRMQAIEKAKRLKITP